MGISAIIWLVVGLASGLLCCLISVGMLVLHPWLLIYAAVMIALLVWRCSRRERSQRSKHIDASVVSSAIMDEVRQHEANMKIIREDTSYRRPTHRHQVLDAPQLTPEHHRPFRPWAGR